MPLLITYVVLSIFFSFMCSIWEAVLLSITPAYANTKLQEGSSMGKSLQEFKQDIDKPLSAILTLNTIAHTVGAISVGSKAGELFSKSSPLFELFGIIVTWESVIAVLMTLAILILSEIIPKTIGASNWKRLAPFTVKSINFLLFILKPLIWMSSLITRRFKGGGGHGSSVLSRADFLAMTSVVSQSGTLGETESKTIKNLLTLEKLKVEDIMTPRTVLKIANETQSINGFYQGNKNLRFSRIPVFKNKEDDITGFILKDELLKEIIEGNGENNLATIRRDVVSVDRNQSLDKLLKKMITDNLHIVVVRDQYGSLVGLSSLEDLFETIHGLEIMDEFDSVEDLQKMAKSIWQKKVDAANN